MVDFPRSSLVRASSNGMAEIGDMRRGGQVITARNPRELSRPHHVRKRWQGSRVVASPDHAGAKETTAIVALLPFSAILSASDLPAE